MTVKMTRFWSLLNLFIDPRWMCLSMSWRRRHMSVIFAVVITLQRKKEGKDKTILQMHLKKHKDPAYECKIVCNISPLGRSLPHVMNPNTKRRMNYVHYVTSDLQRRLISMNTKWWFHEQNYILEARLVCPYTSYTETSRRKHKFWNHVNKHTGV